MKSKSFLIAAIVLFSSIVIFNSSIAKADVHVYDNNNQYLGILVGMSDHDLDLFIPSLSGIFNYSTDYSYWCGDEWKVVFESSNCTGTPYATVPFPLIFDFNTIPIGGFNKVDYSAKKSFTPGSYYDLDGSPSGGCGCHTGPVYPSAEYYPFVQVQMPFTTPVAQPLRFEVRTRAVVIPLN